MAAVFDDAIGSLASRFFEIIKRGSVGLSELDEFSALAPSEIDPASEERACYQDILLKEPDKEDASALSRRLSVLLILKVTGLLGREPKPDEIRWILYAGYDSEGRALDLASSALEALDWLRKSREPSDTLRSGGLYGAQTLHGRV
ncbi:hypothetical protein SAMN04488518_1242 [Pseudovibrio ascidiaceicola]|uniref:DUF3775 domain-containing protein n=1 Tax=Pseudovibrio ascidiaceicola TaxID=285279 RepID=A0A1I4FYY9_9HYPH|nr:hypothetical protein [Pseudovibrio ascidiaceicola]SFL22673.1 hypothetical protein SAMN04488518_1242 [Pseudovibrio ascidiaceicola]